MRKLRTAALVVAGVVSLSNAASGTQPPRHSYKPPAGFVPDTTTAVRVAEAVLVPVCGQSVVDAEKPLFAELQGSVWIVRGTLKAGPGGVARVEIAKSDGRILRMTHSR